ncbi:unnamed protein product, partial [Urochloa humidicola]
KPFLESSFKRKTVSRVPGPEPQLSIQLKLTLVHHGGQTKQKKSFVLLAPEPQRSATVGHSGINSSLAATGTIGYIAPEYGQCVHASTCGDVYSFGIVLLEMLISKRPTDSMFGDDLSIVSFVERNYPDQVLGKIDAHLQEECKGSIQAMPEAEKEINQCLLSLLQVSLSCTRLLPRERMNMREVAINLHAIRRSYVAAIKQE